jgi:hypothetical protein
MVGFRSFSSRRRAAALALLAALAAGLVVRWAVETPVYALGSDHVQHLLIARSLAAGEGFHSGGSQHPDLTRPPLIPVLTAGLSWSTGADVETAAKILVLVTSALIVVPLYVLARNAFGWRAGLAALPIGAFSSLVATAGLMTEPLFVLFGLSAAAATWSGLRRGRPLALLAAGAFAGICALSRFEGLALVPLLALWAILGTGRPHRGPATRAFFALALVGGALALYAPYAAWVSVRLGRWEPAPGIQYLRDTRTVSDRLKLRDVEGGPDVEWFERSQYLVARDHRRRILETYFTDRTLLEPDPDMMGADAAIDHDNGPPPRWMDLAKRRTDITLENLRVIPYTLYDAGLLPALPVALGAIGTIAALRKRRTRRAMAYVASLAAVSFIPATSHVEARFLYLPFVFGLVVSAEGWGWLAGRLPGSRGLAGRVARVAVHAAIVVLIAYTGVHHHTGHSGRYQVASSRKALGPLVARELPPGPILAVQMHVPFWAGRPYRPIPVGDIALVLDYARSEGAAGLVFDDKNDLPRRPHLSLLMEDPPPAGLRLVLSRPLPGGGEVRVFALSPPP